MQGDRITGQLHGTHRRSSSGLVHELHSSILGPWNHHLALTLTLIDQQERPNATLSEESLHVDREFTVLMSSQHARGRNPGCDKLVAGAQIAQEQLQSQVTTVWLTRLR